MGFTRLRRQWEAAAAAESGAAIVGGKFFSGDPTGTVHALDLRSGCALWAFQAGAPLAGSPVIGAVVPGRFTVFFRTTGGVLFALDFETGQLRWKSSLPAAVSGELRLHMETIYLPGPRGVEALAGVSGKPLWTAGPPSAYSLASDAASNLIFGVSPPERKVFALDAAGGNLAWETILNDAPAAAPVLADGNRLAVAMRDGTLAVFDPRKGGAAAWHSRLAGGNHPWSLASGDGRIYASCPGGSLAALDSAGGKVLWTNPGSPGELLAIPGAVLRISREGIVEALSGATGTRVWSQNLGSAPAFTSSAAAQQSLLIHTGAFWLVFAPE
jgi:outer membrane protein assembly factor BamB